MISRQKKLLVVGGGYADIPLILAAKELGYYVITSGNRPDELGHQYSDSYRHSDFSDPEAILALAEQLKIDAICACCNDFSALSCAYVAEKMGLPGHDPYETLKTIHHKDKYRAFAQANGIPTPSASGFSDIDEALIGAESLRFPLIIKPIDLTGGKGVSTVEVTNQLRPALDKAFGASRAKRVVVEEFITGTRHGFSTFLNNGRVVFYFSDNEHYYLNPFLVSAASTPSIVAPAIEQKLVRDAEKIASLLAIKTGIFHIQYILRSEEPIIIEICRRAPGDLYIKFVEHATGVPYPKWIVKASAGLDCSGLAQSYPKGYFTRHCVMSARTGVVKDVVFEASIRHNVIDSLMWWKKGDLVADVLTSKLGIVFLRFDSQQEMLDKTESMQELIRVDIE